MLWCRAVLRHGLRGRRRLFVDRVFRPLHSRHDRRQGLPGAGGDNFRQVGPWSALAVCLLFGFLDAVVIRLQGVAVPGIGEIPVQNCPRCCPIS
jgi:hypothetical protein